MSSSSDRARVARSPSLRVTCLLRLARVSLYEIERADSTTAYALANDASATILDDDQLDRLIAILERVDGANSAQVSMLRTALAPRRGDA